MRLIDADALVEELLKGTIVTSDLYGMGIMVGNDHAVKKVAEEPTIEAEPVRHGRWLPIKITGTFTIFACSECSEEVEAGNPYFGEPTKHISKCYPYCHCGAKMDATDTNVGCKEEKEEVNHV